MKRILFKLSFVFLLCSFIKAEAQNITNSGTPVDLTVGGSGTFEFIIGAENGSYTNFQWIISFPPAYVTANSAPTGTPYTWVNSAPNEWRTTIPQLNNMEFVTAQITVVGTNITSNGLALAKGETSGFFEGNVNTTDDWVNVEFAVTASTNVISVTASNTSPQVGSLVTLTASGCPSPGMYINWTPSGGTISGSNNQTYAVTAPSTPGVPQTYTVQCSTGGNTASVQITPVAAAQDAIIASANPTSVSPGGSSQLTASGCVNNSYNWTWSGGSSSGSTINVTPTTTTTYTATCANAAGGTSTTSVTVTVNQVACAANAGTLN
jgi:hypothetical protein